MARDRVGTCGWDYRHWASIYARTGAGDRLAAYATLLDAVEIDSTFYRLPSAATAAAWAARVPSGFRFAAKASRYLTHVRRLADPQQPVRLLLERLDPLGDHLEVVVVQLPPTLRLDVGRLELVLAAFRDAVPRLCVAVEPRHDSWFVDDVRRTLESAGAILAWTDRRPCRWRTSETGYVRFHDGLPPGREGRRWADAVAETWPAGAWVVFNNDAGGVAVGHARRMRELLARRRGRPGG